MFMSSVYMLSFVAAIALVAVLSLVFFWEIVSLIVNVALLYLIAMRVYYKWKQNDFFHYVIGIAAGVVIVMLVGNLFPFWRITNVAVVSAIISEIIYWFPQVRAKSRRRTR